MLLRAGLREFSRRKIQTALAFLGIAVGAAVVVAIDTASNSVKRGFEISNETVNGRATHRVIGGPAGLAENLYVELVRGGGKDVLAPFVTGSVQTGVDGAPALRIIGVDPLVDSGVRGYLGPGLEMANGSGAVDPFTVYMTPEAAARVQVEPGDTFEVIGPTRTTRLRVGELFAPTEDLYRKSLTDAVLADIALAQHVLSMRGRLSHIDVVSADNGVTLGQRLSSEVQLITTGSATRAQRAMLKAFDTNLLALSLLALLIGVFLIYNTMTFSVVRRRQSIGMLRAVGVTRGGIFAQILGEAAILGAVASFCGVALGVLLAHGLVSMLTQTVSDLYFRTEVARLDVGVWTLVRGWLMGTAATVAAAAVPAFEATRTPPRAVMSRADLEQRAGRWSSLAMLAGFGMLVIAAVLVMLPVRSLLPAFAGMFFLISGFALLIPRTIPAIVNLVLPVVRRIVGLEGVMGARYVARSTSRTGVAVAALAVAVSATMGVGIMIGSFRTSVIDWLDTRLRSDVYITVPVAATLPPAFRDELADLPAVRSVGLGKRTRLVDESRSINLFALETTPTQFAGYLADGADVETLWAAFNQPDAVFISEPYANRHQLGVGDSVSLPTVSGARDFSVEGIYTDYASDQGVVLIARANYVRHFDDQAVNAASLALMPDASPDAVKNAVQMLSGAPPRLEVQSNRDLKDASLVVFDRTFAVTSVLRLLAIVVAAIGIVSALMALQFERAREFSVLRAVGVTPGQVAKVATTETTIIGLASGLAAAPLGVLIAWLLIRVINERSFGWTMGFHPDVSMVLQGIALAVVAALAAGVLPTLRVMRQSPAQGLRNE